MFIPMTTQKKIVHPTQGQEHNSHLVQPLVSMAAKRLDIEPNPIDFHREHAVSRRKKILHHQSSSFNLPPTDWEIIVSSPLSLYNKDKFAFFQQYTNRVIQNSWNLFQ